MAALILSAPAVALITLAASPTLEWTTYLGGSAQELSSAIAAASNGDVVVAGYTTSADFPRDRGAAYQGGKDVIVTRIAADGRSRVWSLLMGGAGDDIATAVAIDGAGRVYVAGYTTSADFPTVGLSGPRFVPPDDGFVACLEADGTVVWSRFLGSTGSDEIHGAAIDPSGDLWLVGHTDAPDFPVMGTPALRGPDGGIDIFVVGLDSASGTMLSSTLAGGSRSDRAISVQVIGPGRLYVAGHTASADFPRTVGPSQSGSDDALGAVFTMPAGLTWARRFSGSAGDYGWHMAKGAGDELVIAGETASRDAGYSKVVGTCGGNVDGFAAVFFPDGGQGESLCFGGSGFDALYASAPAPDGGTYLIGSTSSPELARLGGGDAMLITLGPDWSLVSSLAIGGSANDSAYAVASLPGSLWLVGETTSPDLAADAGAQRALAGGVDLFVARFRDGPVPAEPGALNVTCGCGSGPHWLGVMLALVCLRRRAHREVGVVS